MAANWVELNKQHLQIASTLLTQRFPSSSAFYIISLFNSRVFFSTAAVMFSALRGPASISRVLRASSTALRVPSSKPTSFSLLVQSAKPSQSARYLHITSQFRQDNSSQSHGPTITKFEELADQHLVHANVINQITKSMGHSTMTEVQSKTISVALQGTDM